MTEFDEMLILTRKLTALLFSINEFETIEEELFSGECV
jgi:hypothetical protein